MKHFLKFILATLIGFILTSALNAQAISLVANPSTSDFGHSGNPIAIGNTIYFKYKNANNNFQLAKYDGITLTVIPNPSASDFGYSDNPVSVGNTLYFRYKNANSKYQLAKYDGSTLTLIPNPSASDYGYSGAYGETYSFNTPPIVIGTTIYFAYHNANNKCQLAKYDGSTLTVISNVSTSDYGYIDTPIPVGNTLYFRYQDLNSILHLAKYDGTTLTVIPNASTSDPGCFDNLLAIGNTMYFRYKNSNSNYQLAKYDGNTLTVISNPSASDIGFVGDKFVSVGNTLYSRYYTNVNQLAKYDGNTLTVVPNPFPIQVSLDKKCPIVIGNTLYFQCQNLSTFKFQLAKYDGSTLTVIPNPSNTDIGYNDSIPPIVIANTLYFCYRDANNKYQLAKYDGSTLTVIPNPSNSDIGYYYDVPPISIANTLYFKYQNANNKYQLAKYDGSTLTVISNPSASNYGYYDNPITIGNTLYFRYLTAGNFYVAKYDGSSLTVVSNPSVSDYGYYGSPLGIGNTLYFQYYNNVFKGQLAVLATPTWTGATNTVWTTTTNWNTNTVPTSTDDVVIPNVTNKPDISTGTQSVNSLTINSGASISLSSNLQVANTLTNNGTITGTGNLTLNGTSTQTIAGSGTISNLTLNNSTGATITSGGGNTQSITGTLTPTLGTLTTNGNLVLKSTSITNTAMVGIVGGSISGNVTVERFIPAAQRSFRFLTPGVTTTSSIKTNWQENQNNTSTLFANNINTSAGYGTHITGSATGLNGFDATATGGASMFTFSNNSGQTWSSISNTNSNVLSAGTAYRLLVRGSRAVNLSSATPTIDATTLRATGALKTGTVIFNSTGTGTNVLASPTISATINDYSFIGNPYWAPVDWNALSKTNVGTTYYLWDPTKAGTNSRGGYVSYTTGSGSSGGGTINQYLQPGQGVFIKTSGASPSITFTEANKALSSSNLTTTFRTNNTIDGRLNINLYLEQNYAARKTADAAAIVFSNNFSKAIGNEDAEKFINPDENISIKLNEKLLGLNGIQLPQQQDTVWLNMQNMLGNKYKLEVTGEGFTNNNLEAYLMDNYLNTKIAIKLNDSIAVDYSIDNASSAASNRFTIVFEKVKPILLNAALQIKLSPNPVADVLTINYEGLNEKEATTISIVDMNGKIMKTIEVGKVPSGNQRINIKDFSNGVYNVQLMNAESKQTQSFIKQ